MLGHPVAVGLTETRMTLSISLPAASRIALMFLQQAAVLSAMLPPTKFPSLSAGSCPDTKTKPAARVAWL